MKKLFAVTMSAVMALSLTACSSSSNNASADNSSTTNEATADTSGKTVVTLAKENDVISMNTAYATDGMSFEMIVTPLKALKP